MKTEKSLFYPSPEPLKIAVLVLDDSNTLSFAAAVDPMRAANRRAGKRLFDWSFYSATGAPALLTSGLSIPASPIADLAGCDLLLIIAGFHLDARATPQLRASLRRLEPRCRALAGIDGGSWIMARAGLLDGHDATTHWEDLDAFSTLFPNINTLRHRYVISEKFITSGGATPCIDMMLHLIRTRYGTDLATRVASAFIYDPIHQGDAPQSQIATAQLARRHPRLARAVALMESHIEDPLTIPDIAASLGISPRHFEARFRAAMATTPKAFYLALRLSEARRLASDTALSVQEIAFRTGFGAQASLARAFRAAYGQSIRDLRRTAP